LFKLSALVLGPQSLQRKFRAADGGYKKIKLTGRKLEKLRFKFQSLENMMYFINGYSYYKS